MDIYTELLGPAPTDPARQKAVADALRRRSQLGTVGAITGDRVLAPMGQSMMKSADADAEQLQRTRQADIDDAQTRRYQDAQIGHMGNVLRETIRNNNLDYDAAMAGIEGSLLRATLGGGRQSKLTLGDRNKLEKLSTGYNGMVDTIGSFKDEYTQKLGAGPQSTLPNTLASFGIGTKGSKEASDWWAQWRVLYTLGERNQLFGATLTPAELQAWKENEITPNMSADQVRSRMNVLHGILRRRAGTIGKTYSEQFGPEIMESYNLPETGEALGGDNPTATIEARRTGKSAMSLDDINARIRELEDQLSQ